MVALAISIISFVIVACAVMFLAPLVLSGIALLAGVFAVYALGVGVGHLIEVMPGWGWIVLLTALFLVLFWVVSKVRRGLEIMAREEMSKEERVHA